MPPSSTPRIFMIACFSAMIFPATAEEWKSDTEWIKPSVVDPGPAGGPPADAIVLFGGKDMSAFVGGENWKLAEGYVVADKGGITTKQPFGSCQLHLEFASPLEDKDPGQGRGNSGIYLMGRYEVQILDSFKNDTYPDGQAAAIYKQSPPLVNASRPPGEWQSFDILFRAPEFHEDGSLGRPAAVTVLHNGVVVQHDFELEGSTHWDQPPAYENHSKKLPIHIQFHGDPVRFRNIWIRELEEQPRIKAATQSPSKPANADPRVQLLWPAGAPQARGNSPDDRPTLQVFEPETGRNVGTAIVICPGGGYSNLAAGHEGREIAHWLQSLGITAFVLDYRHRGKGYGHPAPLDDAKRAIRVVRSEAAALGIEPDRVGIMGFSAGGHLASSAATHFDPGDPTAADPIERLSSRPDFVILGYPLIALGESYTHSRSQRNLLGETPSKEMLAKLSSQKQVTSDTPPTFLWHTGEDTGVLPENSVAFYLALRKAQVPAELHIYERGRHGLGLARSVPATADWTDRCVTWLRNRGLLKRAD